MAIVDPTRKLTNVLEQAAILDAPAKLLAGKVRHLTAAAKFNGVISGTGLGHPAHPPMTDLSSFAVVGDPA